MRRMTFKILVFLMGAVLLAGCGKEEISFQEVTAEELDEKGVSGESTEAEEMIYVHVCGQVANPGVYKLSKGSRVYEAIEAAGGLRKEAASEFLNQAQILEDGQQLAVPSKEELKNQEMSGGIGADGKVNLNKATKEELMTLPGIGEAKADAIIRYRDEQGGFQSIEELMEIEGIKEGVFEKVKHQITAS